MSRWVMPTNFEETLAKKKITHSDYLGLRAEARAMREKCGEKGHDFKMNKVVGVEYCTKCGKGRDTRGNK